jgi:hypothetical protein
LQRRDGGWLSFHNLHIVHICDAIIPLLPPGYYAENEESLQITLRGDEEGKVTRTYPDVGIYQTTGRYPTGTQPASAAAPTATLPIADTEAEIEYIDSVVIKLEREGELFPVTRIELLSPANKPDSAYYPRYMTRRYETLSAGITLVEIDYLHEMPPIRSALPSYRNREEGAFPYQVLVSEPQPTVSEGRTAVYGFGVDEEIPVVPLPLANGDVIALPLGEVYHHTFAARPSYGEVRVDYEVEPPNFESYTPDDQERIRARMAAVRALRSE